MSISPESGVALQHWKSILLVSPYPLKKEARNLNISLCLLMMDAIPCAQLHCKVEERLTVNTSICLTIALQLLFCTFFEKEKQVPVTSFVRGEMLRR